MRLGIGSWTYGWATGVGGYPRPAHPLTAADLIDRAHAYGLDVVQLADNLPVDQLSSTERADLRAHATESGIEIELGTSGFTPEHLNRYLDLAVFLGARLVRTLIRTPDGKTDLAHVEKCIGSVADAFRSASVVLAIENYEQVSCAELASLVRGIANPCVGICLDTVNSLGALETPRQVVAALGPYVCNLHIKDFTIRRLPSKMGYEVLGCPAGQGKLEIDWIVNELRKLGRSPTIILEQWTPWAGSIEQTVATEADWAEHGVRLLERYH